MAPMSRGVSKHDGKVAGVKRKLVTTASSNLHRFESFSGRIAKIKIDPVHRSTRVDSQVSQDDRQSFFGSAFAEWRELNLSETFTNFSKEAGPFCHNLAQVMLHQAKIVEVLLKYLNKSDPLALEPVLDLVSHLAHDLETQFETHFYPIVTTVSKLAAASTSVDVIEWSFNCLAWLFKYLSRLLVPNLRPTFQIMAPLLGMDHQKPFVLRFCAEAMSFLVRKAAARKDSAPLKHFVEEALSGLTRCSKAQSAQFAEGLVLLFADAVKGVQRGVHSTASSIVESLFLLWKTAKKEQTAAARNVGFVVQSVLVNVIHHTDADGFQPLEIAIATFIQSEPSEFVDCLELHALILFTISGTRKGSRIKDWSLVVECISELISKATSTSMILDSETKSSIIAATALVLQYAPLPVVMRHASSIVSHLEHDLWDSVYFKFCIIFAKLGSERFGSLVFPGMRRLITNRWERHQNHMCLVLRKLSSLYPDLCGHTELLGQLQISLRSNLELLSSSVRDNSTELVGAVLDTCNQHVKVLEALSSASTLTTETCEVALRVVRQVTAGNQDPMVAKFVFGPLVKLLARGETLELFDADLVSRLLHSCDHQRQQIEYLEAMQRILPRAPSNSVQGKEQITPFFDKLVPNLSSPSHHVRLLSLEIVSMLYMKLNAGTSRAFSEALNVESLPPTLENARSISMGIRRIASAYAEDSGDAWIRRALPIHCFGLLHTRLSSVWEDACLALVNMANVGGSEDVIVHQAVVWLRDDPGVAFDPGNEPRPDDVPAQTVRSLGCTNVDSVNQLIRDVECSFAEDATMKEDFDANASDVRFLPQTSNTSRGQALRVLAHIPNLVEKRSRIFVPFLFQSSLEGSSSSAKIVTAEQEKSVLADNSTPSEDSNWLRKDQKALLKVFAQFSNPTVLYRSREVYEALLGLLSNGDGEIQKAAMNAVLSWKSPSVAPYQEHLLNLVDDAKFKDELAVLLGDDDEGQIIQLEHRPALMPILLRLLYGRIIARSGSSQGTVEAKRRTVLNKLTQLQTKDFAEFVLIALGPLHGLDLVKEGQLNESLLQDDLLAARKQIGVLKVLEDTLESIYQLDSSLFEPIINAILYCVIRATRSLNEPTSTGDHAVGHESLLRSIRHQALIALNAISKTCADFDWHPYASIIITEIVQPRLGNLPIETAQAPSILLKLFSTWAESYQTVGFLLRPNQQLLFTIANCLTVKSARNEVRIFVMKDIFDSLVDLALGQESSLQDPNDSTSELCRLLRERLGFHILKEFTESLPLSQSKEYVETGIGTTIKLVPFLDNSPELSATIVALARLLEQPANIVDYKVKGQVLKLIEGLLHSSHDRFASQDARALFDAICPLFRLMRVSSGRTSLVAILHHLAKHDGDVQNVAHICDMLNSFSSAKLDAPDFDRRLEAYRKVNEELYVSLNDAEWRVLLHNFLFFIKDNEELSIRSSASLCLRRFIQIATDGTAARSGLSEMLKKIVLPALSKGMGERSELVRAEFVLALSELVKQDWPKTNDMKCLLGTDEESSFFNNIIHLQHHRRVRALRRLSAQAASLSPTSSSLYLLPLLENFLSSSEADSQNLAVEAASTLGALAENFDWSAFAGLLSRKVVELAKLDSKLRIRTVGALVDCLTRAQQSKVGKGAEATLIDVENAPSNGTKLSTTLPDQDILAKRLSKSLIAPFMEHVHFKDESEVAVRLPAAVIVVKALMLLPPEEANLRLETVLSDVCNVLKSRAQEARDSARKALSEICAIVGPRYFGFVVSALRSSLRRGYQVHVLSYTLHSILIAVAQSLQIGDLDYCLTDIMPLLMDDVFGVAGQEKDAQDYISQMKEVKQKSRSFDSVELLASITTPSHISELLQPIRSQLESRKPRLGKVDQMLARLREGLRRNESVNSQKVLVLCYEILRDAYLSADAEKSYERPLFFKLAAFALETLRRILDKHEELKTPENLSGFVPLLARSMDQKHDDVQIAAFRFLTSIIKFPLKMIDENAGGYIRQVRRTIEAAPSTNEPVAQAALRLASAVLRERTYAVVKQSHFETDVAYVLKRIKPDLEVPSRQSDRDRQLAAFNFIKAVTNRGVLINEVYEVMEVVREVMISSQETPVPSLARSIYSRFVLDYFPEEGKGLSKQLGFLVSNLQYPQPRGRLSVMEVMLFVLNKKDRQSVQPILTELFLPLILVAISDESAECQQSALVLLSAIMERADRDRIKTFKVQMHKWLDPETNVIWRTASALCWKIYLDKFNDAKRDAASVHSQVQDIILANQETKDPDASKLLHAALDLLALLCTVFPALAFAAGAKQSWSAIIASTASKAPSVRLASASLAAQYFSHFARHATDQNLRIMLPLNGPYGLKFDDDDAKTAVRASIKAIRRDGEDQLRDQLIQNLSFLARIALESEGSEILDELFSQAAVVARLEINENTLKPKQAVLRLLGSLCTIVPLEKLQPSLQSILLPLRNLTDSSISQPSFLDPVQSAQQEEIIQTAHELLEQIQAKVGTAEFIDQMQQLQKEVTERRDDRRAKRRIEAVSVPEKAQRDKQRKHEAKKSKRREKNALAAGKRRGW